MCGIIAVLALDEGQLNGGDGLEEQLHESLTRIEHRGPDAKDIWVHEGKRCDLIFSALAHCRLAINDLTSDGEQPLHSRENLIHAVVNGEIYDYDRIRAQLEKDVGYRFKGRSDSELVVALYLSYGTAFLSYLRGEFALVIYDTRSDLLLAARDRYGIKPLFWRVGEGKLMLAAEAKAFLPLGWKPEWDVEAIVAGGWGQDTRTMFKGVNKLRPGHYLLSRAGSTPEMRPYWDAQYPDKRLPEPRSEEEMILKVRELLIDAVRLRLRADVPVGIYLSGGIDSSALAGIAAHLVKQGETMGSLNAKERICCFSIGFDKDSGFDESQISMRTANHHDVLFYKKHMDEQELASRFEDAIYHCEHHSHDLNFVGKYALSEVPRQHGYKVVLTDEHFAGYPLYQPDFLREPDYAVQGAGPVLHVEQRKNAVNEYEDLIKDSYEKMGATSEYFTDTAASRQLNNITVPASMLAFNPPLRLFARSVQKRFARVDPRETVANNIDGIAKQRIRDTWHPLHSAMYVWGKGHLTNQFLSCLGDRVEMAHSVEARTPFLDHVLTEYVNGLPPSIKLRWFPSTTAAGQDEQAKATPLDGKFVEKWILREAVKPFVTQEVYGRTKFAYSAPTTYPTGGPVHTLLQRLVTEESVGKLGFVDWAVAKELLEAAFAGVEGEEKVAAKSRAWRLVLLVASWVVLAERFEVAPAS